MSLETSKPLVSFCLMCYNQEDYIGEALLAAINQTYSNLEIIVSDDCSLDGSWDILNRIASEYGDKRNIRLYRNSRNLGLGLNWCQLCKYSNGELIVKADGDDISLPGRVEALVDEWLCSGRQALLVSHSYALMDLQGHIIGHKVLPITGEDTRTLEEIYAGKGFFHQGAGSMYHRSLYREFGDFRDKRAADDTVFVGRAVLLSCMNNGRFRIAQGEWVKYRVGSGTTTFTHDYRKGMIKGLRLGVYSQKQLLHDLDKFSHKLSSEAYAFYADIFTRRLNHHENVLKLYEGNTFKERLVGFKETYNGRPFSLYGLINFLLLLPPALGNSALALLMAIKAFFVRKRT